MELGVSHDYVTYYDKLLRIEFSINHLGERKRSIFTLFQIHLEQKRGMTIAIFGSPYPEHFTKYIQHLVKKLESEHVKYNRRRF